MSTTLRPATAPSAPPAATATRGRSRTLLRIAAAIYAFFALGHTLGGMLSDTHRGPGQAALFLAMRSYTFDAQGVTRSYWDFYRGFGFMVSVLLAFAAVLAWVLGDIGQRNPADARRVLLPLIGAMAFTAWFSFVDFFAVPMVFSTAGLVILILAAIALGRDATSTSSLRTRP